jgi:predicted glycosyltransferase
VKRILIYSHDTFGLGNVRRMLEIARHLVASSPEITVLLLTGSPMLHAFRIPPRIDLRQAAAASRGTRRGRYGGALRCRWTCPNWFALRANT